MRDVDGGFLIKKIVLDTNLKNTRAQHVYEKLGFRKMRVNVDSWQDQLGQWQSTVDYELVRELDYR
jgi:ribosomal protein S18 acetylase RimI-like enzyme